jgi:hypothetical protein
MRAFRDVLWLPVLCGAMMVTLTACDRSATAPEVEPDLVIAEMVMVDDGGTAIFSHLDHWHGFPVVPAAGSVSLQKYFVALGTTADDHDMPSRDKWFTLGDKGANIRVRHHAGAVDG